LLLPWAARQSITFSLSEDWRRMLAKNYPNTYAYAPWWINPFWYSSIMLLGMYVVTVYFSDEIIRLSSGQKVNSLNGEGILLGLLSVLSIAVGSSFVVFRQKSKCIATPYSANNINQVLLCLGVFIAICTSSFGTPWRGYKSLHWRELELCK